MEDTKNLFQKRFHKMLFIYSLFVFFLPFLIELSAQFLFSHNGPHIKGYGFGQLLLPVWIVVAMQKGEFRWKIAYITLPAIPIFFTSFLGVYLVFMIKGYAIDWLKLCVTSCISLLIATFIGIIIAWLSSERILKEGNC